MATKKKRTTVKKKYDTMRNDEEVLAIARIRRQLMRLEPEARGRVVDWIANKFESEGAPPNQ